MRKSLLVRLSLVVAFAGAVSFGARSIRAEGGGDLLVSDVLISDDGLAAVTLNDAIQVREIQFTKTEGRMALRFPEYVSKSGKVYPQVSVQSKKLYDAIVEAISTNKPSPEKAKSIKFTVAQPHVLRSKTRKANVEITFNDALSLTVGVMQSNRPGKDPFWVSYPARKPEGGGKFINQIVLTNPKLKKAVESAIISKYQRVVGEESGGAGEDEE